LSFSFSCTDSADTAPAVEAVLSSLENLPDINLSNFDFSKTEAIAGFKYKSFGEVGEFSYDGCMVNTGKNRTFSESLMVPMLQEYIKSITANQTIPVIETPLDEDYLYLSVTGVPIIMQDPENPGYYDMKTRVVRDTDSDQLIMQACLREADTTNAYKQVVTFKFAATENATDATLVDLVGSVETSSPDQPEGTTPDSRMLITINGFETEADTWETAEFNMLHSSEEEDNDWSSQEILSADNDSQSNTMQAYQSSDTWGSTKFYARWNATYGSAKVSWAGYSTAQTASEYGSFFAEWCEEEEAWPEDTTEGVCVNCDWDNIDWYDVGLCADKCIITAPNTDNRCSDTHDGSSSFQIATSATGAQTYTIIANDDANYSPNYYVEVAATSYLDAPETDLTWTDAWDCNLAGVYPEVALDAENLDFTGATDVSTEQALAHQELDHSCDQLANEAALEEAE